MSSKPTSNPTGQTTGQTTGRTTGDQSTGLPHWMPGGGVDTEHEPVFSELVDDLDLVNSARP